MAVNFTDFTTGGTLASDHYLVGYDVNASGGEKKWKYDTLMRAVSSSITPELINKINQNSGDGTVTNVTGTSPISVANGTTTPSITLGTVPIANGGTGQTTAANALSALLPTQTGNDGKFLTTNGSTASWASLSASPTSAKAWVNFNGTGTTGTAQISASYNVSSVTLNGAGLFSVNMTNALDDDKYVVVGTASQSTVATNCQVQIHSQNQTGSNTFKLPTNSSFYISIVNNNGANVQPYSVALAVFR